MMDNHRTKIVGRTGGWQAKCTCIGPDSPIYEYRWEADDWVRAHMQTVKQVRAHLKNTRPPKPDDDWKPGDPAPDGSVDVPLPLF
jgi:hypothetical protein